MLRPFLRILTILILQGTKLSERTSAKKTSKKADRDFLLTLLSPKKRWINCKRRRNWSQVTAHDFIRERALRRFCFLPLQTTLISRRNHILLIAFYFCFRTKWNMGGEVEADRIDPSAARGGVRRNGSRREGGWCNSGRFLPQEDAASGELERGSAHVGVFNLLHQGRVHAYRQRRSEHPAGYPAMWSAHTQWALRFRESRGYHNSDTEKRSSDLRQRPGSDRAADPDDRFPRNSGQKSRFPVQSSGSRCVLAKFEVICSIATFHESITSVLIKVFYIPHTIV